MIFLLSCILFVVFVGFVVFIKLPLQRVFSFQHAAVHQPNEFKKPNKLNEL